MYLAYDIPKPSGHPNMPTAQIGYHFSDYVVNLVWKSS